MNTVSLNKSKTRTVAKVASLLVLAALAIAFFAFPMASFAMGCGGKGKSKTTSGIVAGHVQFEALIQDTPGTKNSLKTVTPPNPNIEQLHLLPAAQVTSLAQWSWLKTRTEDGTNTEVYVTLSDLKGHGWTADTTNSGNGNAYVMVDGLSNLTITAAPKHGVLP
jgi:hypothetical protein